MTSAPRYPPDGVQRPTPPPPPPPRRICPSCELYAHGQRCVAILTPHVPDCPSAMPSVGWTCPRCHKVNSPDVSQCDCEPQAEAQEGTVTLVEGERR